MFNKENYLFAVLVLTFGIFNADLVAQDEAADNVEEVVITGSRIKRDSLNSAAQVTTITSEDIAASSGLITADVLRQSIYNSFGSTGPTAGSSAMSNATINMRGLGAARTLILMDGRRMPGSPHLGGSGATNINMIPTVAVDRIEILADGASSVYGSDAIAGVVNVITKKGFDGMEFNFRRGDRDRDDGEENSVSFIYGATNDKGYVTVMVEHDERDEIYLKDRWYTQARANDTDGDGVVNMYTESYGISWYSQNLADPVTGDLFAAPTCPGSMSNPVDGWWGPNFGGEVFGQPGTVTPTYAGAQPTGMCGYAWADIMVQDAATFRDSITTNIEYEINDQFSLYSRVNYLRNESTGRFAPPAAAYPGILASDPANPFDEPVQGYWRWTEIGNRGMHFVDTGMDAVFELTYTVNDDIEVVYGTQINKFYGTDIGRYYVDYAGLDSNLYNDIPFGSEAGLYALSATTLVEYTNHYEKNDVVVQIDNIMDLPGGSVQALVGMENITNEYAAEYDKHSEGGLVGGSAGNSSAGYRDNGAMFGELLLPVLDNLEVTASFRSDSYSDVGDSSSYKVGALYVPKFVPNTVVKVNLGEGFRAPTMSTLYAVTTFSANSAYDYKACAASGVSTVDCPSRQISTLITANSAVEAETSESFTFSVEHDFGWMPALEGLTARFDSYNITVNNAIVSAGTQSVMWNDFLGGTLLTDNYEYYDAEGISGDGTAAGNPVGTGSTEACPEGATYVKRKGVSDSVYVIRSCANGRVDYVGASTVNVGMIEVIGYDLFLDYTMDIPNWGVGEGTMNFFMDYSDMGDYNTDAFVGSSRQVNNIGFSGLPGVRYNYGLNYSFDKYFVSLINRVIGDFRFSSEAETVGGELTGGIVKAGDTQDEYSTLDLQLGADLGSMGKVTFGILNLEDVDPLPDGTGNYETYIGLYDNRGMTSYFRWRLNF
jgi:iron complex outermembrane receptor protein